MCPSNDNVKTSESVKSLRFRDWTKGIRGGELEQWEMLELKNKRLSPSFWHITQPAPPPILFDLSLSCFQCRVKQFRKAVVTA